MDQRRSEVWKFFQIINGRRVKCNFCHKECSSVISNMKKHLLTKHPTANEILIQVDDEPAIVADQDDSNETPAKSTESLAKDQVDESLMSRKRSLVWKFFDIINDKISKCKFCGKKQSSIISNMKKHLRVKHPTANDVTNCVPPQILDINSSEFSDSEKSSKPSPAKNISIKPEDEPENDEPVFRNSGQRSFVWEFFDKIDHKRALCRLCNKEQSCVTSNMRLHLEKRHSGEQIFMDSAYVTETKPFEERFNEDDSDDSFNYPEETPTSSTCSRKLKEKTQTFDSPIKIEYPEPKIIECRPNKMNSRSIDDTLMDRKRSTVWKYFRIISANRATCNLCGKEQSNIISNVKKHLLVIHPDAYKEMKRGCKPRKSSVPSYGKRHPPTPAKSTNLILPKKRRLSKTVSYIEPDSDDDSLPNQEEIPSSSTSTFKYNTRKSYSKNKSDDRSSSTDVETIKISSTQFSAPPIISDKLVDKANQILLKLIIKHFQDYNIVQDTEILKFIRTINKIYKLPSKAEIGTNLIPDLYEKCLFQTKIKIKSCKKYCLTIDCWSNIHASNFITVTIHFINDQFILNTILLDCCVIQKQDTPENLAREFSGVLTNWKLKEDDAVLAVLDNSVSNIKCVFAEELKLDAQDCFANVINSIAKDSFSNEWIQNIIDKIKDLISHFKGCDFSSENIAEYQTQRNITPLKLIKDFPRCWNSTFHMLQRFIELEEAIKHALSQVDKELQTLSILEWEVVRQLVNCVKPMDHVMATIKREENFCSASLVVPLINGLKNVYNNLAIKGIHNPVQEVITNIVHNISTNFDGIENVEPFILATFLDPRFKNKAFSSQTVGDQVRDKVVNLLNLAEDNGSYSFQSKRPAQIDENDPQSEFWSFFQDNCNSQMNNTQNSRIIIEVQRYLEDGVVSRLDDPLVWWSKNHISYPRLAELAKERLCCVASSVPCERYFTKRGQTAIENRNKLSTKKTKLLVFLNANYVTEDK